ncbi:MAG: DNA internalization-related competence protein ComEC/Rec2 [candidate division KSB1 bacterium]|nr:DNA internalization-related competence protein ComEC/Rec2 [candidate division KSB1 bacterium]MDZ7364471.1 DNA internalization-related competence protein ComEC/Rec2 [candidate division KSB1 bacterium]MDZ7402843.1 DNA internalization-related competence protein ComEC/Rec2 [candidate division KSB1 bacterium]
MAIAFCLGILLEHKLQLPGTMVSISFIIAFTGAAFIFLRQRKSDRARQGREENSAEFIAKNAWPRLQTVDYLLLAACLTAGMLRTHFELSPSPNAISAFAESSTEVMLLGKVNDLPEHRHERWRFPLLVQRVRTAAGWNNVNGAVMVFSDSLGEVEVGEQLLLRGFLRLADGSRNPGAFDYRAFLQAQDISAIFSCTDPAPLWRDKPRPAYSWRRAIAQSRIWINEQLSRFSHGQSLTLLRGLLIGERDEISKEIIEAFQRTGLVHILAVSGSNVGFIVLIIFVALWLLRVPRRWHLIFFLIGIVFYMFLTGAQPPVVRASIMATVIIIGESLERQADIYNSLGVAAIILLLWQPLQLLQLGFQLSFVAVLGIAYLYRPLALLFRRLLAFRWLPIRWTLSLLAVSFAAQLAILPFSLQAFGRLPVTAILGNLVIIPAAFIIVAATTVACVFSFLEFGLQAFGAIADFASNAMIKFTQWLAEIPLAYVDGVYVSPWLLLFYIITLALFVEWRRSHLARRWLLLAGLIVLNIFVWQGAWAAGAKLRVTFFDVGQGDAALLEFPHGHLLIDAGPLQENYDAAERVLIPFLRTRGIRQLDAVVISHPHADHLGGLPVLLREVKIKKVFICGVETDSPLEQRCEKLADSLRAPVLTLRAGERLPDFAPAEIWVLHPCRGEFNFEKLNDASIVIKVIFGQHAFLFPGDAEFESESHLLESAGVLDSDVLKVGHHGSKSSSLPHFLSAVSPQWAVVSVGRWNNFGHPDPRVLARYDSLGIRLLRTDRDGAVIFETDGKVLKRIR